MVYGIMRTQNNCERRQCLTYLGSNSKKCNRHRQSFQKDETTHLTFESKDTYGQTHGLSNLEMKHLGELAIIGQFLTAVITSWVHTMQGHSYLTWCRLCTCYKDIRPE